MPEALSPDEEDDLAVRSLTDPVAFARLYAFRRQNIAAMATAIADDWQADPELARQDARVAFSSARIHYDPEKGAFWGRAAARIHDRVRQGIGRRAERQSRQSPTDPQTTEEGPSPVGGPDDAFSGGQPRPEDRIDAATFARAFTDGISDPGQRAKWVAWVALHEAGYTDREITDALALRAAGLDGYDVAIESAWQYWAAELLARNVPRHPPLPQTWAGCADLFCLDDEGTPAPPLLARVRDTRSREGELERWGNRVRSYFSLKNVERRKKS